MNDGSKKGVEGKGESDLKVEFCPQVYNIDYKSFLEAPIFVIDNSVPKTPMVHCLIEEDTGWILNFWVGNYTIVGSKKMNLNSRQDCNL